MKWEWNQSVDRLASAALQEEKGTIVTSEQDLQDLISLNCLGKSFIPKKLDRIVNMAAITRSAQQRRRQPEILQEEIVQPMRIERISQAQDEESWSTNLNEYLIGD